MDTILIELLLKIKERYFRQALTSDSPINETINLWYVLILKKIKKINCAQNYNTLKSN